MHGAGRVSDCSTVDQVSVTAWRDKRVRPARVPWPGRAVPFALAVVSPWCYADAMTTYEYRVTYRHHDGSEQHYLTGVSEETALRELGRHADDSREWWIERRPVPAWVRIDSPATIVRSAEVAGFQAGERDRALCSSLADAEHYVAVANGNLEDGPYRRGYLNAIVGGLV